MLVSVIIPTYNRQSLILETLGSVLSQTYTNWECIVVDDGSTDRTINVVIAFCEQDSRFRLIKRSREPKGASTCRNIGFENAKGGYIIFLDSDDLLMPWCLGKRVNTIKEYPGYDFWVFPTGAFYAKPGDSSKKWNVLHKDIEDINRFILQDMPWCTMGPIWSVKAIKLLGGFNEGAVCWQDWELHLRALLAELTYFKTRNTNPDSYFRVATAAVHQAISKNHKSKEHVVFRYRLILDFYNKITAKHSDKQTLYALSVLFFRLIKDLKTNNAAGLIKSLLSFSKHNNIFDPIERILLYLYAINLVPPVLDNLKSKILYKALIRINPFVFSNKVGSTFQA